MNKSEKFEEMSDHDLLIKLNEQVQLLRGLLDNHLKQRWEIIGGAVLIFLGIILN